jgi:DNA-3-methyladenine glycosylase II
LRVQRFTMRPRGPFSLANANQYFGGWLTLASDPASLVMTFPLETWQASASVVVRQLPSGEVTGDVHGLDGSGLADAEAAWNIALAALSLDVDATDYPDVGDRDPVIGRLQQRFEYARPVCFHTPYEAAAAFVIGHRMTIAQTRALRARLAEAHGDHIDVDGQTWHAFPRPSVILELDEFGPVQGEKMERLHGIAHAALEGRLDRTRLREMEFAFALADLQTLRGVGPFIAAGTVIRGAGLTDVVSEDEVTQQAIQQAYDLPSAPDSETIARISEPWHPFRTWCSVLLHMWLRNERQGSYRPAGRGARGGPGSRR